MDGPSYTRRNESCRLRGYLDSRGIPTVGWGCAGADPYAQPPAAISLQTVWTQQQADDEFGRRYALAVEDAAKIVGVGVWACLDEVRRAALADMAYQLGGHGLSRFVNMLSAVRARSWKMADEECMDSDYARQTPARARRIACMLLTGQWPKEPW